MAITVQETFSSKLVNYIEPYEIDGKLKTKFYTELNTDLNIGDRVFIMNGYYDSNKLLNEFLYQNNTDGYLVLEVLNNSIVLDIDWNEDKPVWGTDDFENYTKVYLVNDLNKFNYENTNNNFGFNQLAGNRYSTNNNNIFLSKIEDLPYTNETQTKDKFFKSNLINEPDILFDIKKGYTYNNSSVVGTDNDGDPFTQKEETFYSSKTSAVNYGLDFDYIIDFDISKNDTFNSDILVSAIRSDKNTFSNDKIWLYNKKYDLGAVSWSNGSGSTVSAINNGDSKIIENYNASQLNNISLVKVSNEKADNIVTTYNNFDGYYTVGSRFEFDAGRVSENWQSTVELNSTIMVGFNGASASNNDLSVAFFDYNKDREVVPSKNYNTIGITFSTVDNIFETNNAKPYFILDSGTGSSNNSFPVNNGNNYNIRDIDVYDSYGGYFYNIGDITNIKTTYYNSSYSNLNELEFIVTGNNGIFLFNYSSYHFTDIDNQQDNDESGNSKTINADTLIDNKDTNNLDNIYNNMVSEYGMSMSFPDYINKVLNIYDIEFSGEGDPSILENTNELEFIGDLPPSINCTVYTILTEAGIYRMYCNLNPQEIINKLSSFYSDKKQYFFYFYRIGKYNYDDNEYAQEESYNLFSSTTYVPYTTIERYSQDLLSVDNNQYVWGSSLVNSIDSSSPEIGYVGKTQVNYYEKVNKNVNDIFFFNDNSINKWFFTSADHNPQLLNSDTVNGIYATGTGIDFIDNTFRTFNSTIDTTTPVEEGDVLPSNNTFKILPEQIGDEIRLWVSTDTGLHYIVFNEQQFEYDYYFSINFDENDIPLNDNIYRNNKVLIMEDFEYDGITYKKGNIYKYNYSKKIWELDINYKEAYITKANFEEGDFYENAIWNDGLFGSLNTSPKWNNGTWRNGIFFNSTWVSGTMNSKSDDILSINNYAQLDESNKLKEITDYDNNNGYGYNKVIDSTIEEIDIRNGVFNTSLIGLNNKKEFIYDVGTCVTSTQSGSTYSFSIIKEKIQNSTLNNFHNITISKGSFNSCILNYANITSSKLDSSDINYSKISSNSEMVNTEVNKSIIESGTLENEGIIEILNTDKWFNYIIKPDNTIDVIITYKFYVDNDNFERVNYNDEITFNNVETDYFNTVSVINDKFRLIGGSDGFYDNNFINLGNTLVNGITASYENLPFKSFISKKTKRENQIKTTLFKDNLSEIKVRSVDNKIKMDSIDISLNIGNYSITEDLDNIFNDNVLNNNITNVEHGTIQNKFINNSLITGMSWNNGSHIHDNNLEINYKNNYLDIEVGCTNSILNINLNENNELDIPVSETDIIYLSNIYYEDGSTKVFIPENWIVVDVDNTNRSIRVKSLQEHIFPSLSVDFTTIYKQNSYVFTTKFDGDEPDNIKIKKGLFKRTHFSNTLFDNNDDLSNSIINNLIVTEADFKYDDNNTYKKGLFYRTYFNSLNNDIIIDNIYAHKSLFDKVVFENGTINASAWVDGTFNNGNFINGLYRNINDNLILIKYEGTFNSALATLWHQGTFNNGIMNNSDWMSGTMNDGQLINVNFYGGTFNNGRFGSKNSKRDRNVFRKGNWIDGTFENGIFGDNRNYVSPPNPELLTNNYVINEYNSGGNLIWENGTFNDGIFTNIFIDNEMFYISIWKDGIFNNGEVRDTVIWKDGIFNNGKFLSDYGKIYPPVYNVFTLSTGIDLDSSSNSTGGAYENMTKYDFISLYSEDYEISPSANEDSIRSLFINTSDNNRLTYIYEGSTASPGGSINDLQGYFEKKIEEFFDGTTSSVPLGAQAVDDDIYHPLYKKARIGTTTISLLSGEYYMYSGTSSNWVKENEFIGTTISGTNLIYESKYAWEDGVFNGGQFGNENNRKESNPSWKNGTFNDGKFYGKVWVNGIFTSGDFYGSGVSQQFNNNFIDMFENYKPQETVEKYQTTSNPVYFEAQTLSNQTNYYNKVLNNDWFGLWLNGKVFNQNTLDLQQINPFINSANEIINYAKDRFNRNVNTLAKFYNMLWVDGTFDHNSGIFIESVWLSGSFDVGFFSNSIFNPYVERWDFEKANYITNRVYRFELDLEKCVWNSGLFQDGVFYYSDWNNGTMVRGTMVGSKFKKGVANYLTAFNVIWEDGRWRNGNWYGSNWSVDFRTDISNAPNPFKYLEDEFIGMTYAPPIVDILANNSIRLNTDELHIWNSTDGSYSFSVDDDYSWNEDIRVASLAEYIDSPYSANTTMTAELKALGVDAGSDSNRIELTASTTTSPFSPTKQSANINVILNINTTAPDEFLDKVGIYAFKLKNFRDTPTSLSNPSQDYVYFGYNINHFKLRAIEYDDNNSLTGNIITLKEYIHSASNNIRHQKIFNTGGKNETTLAVNSGFKYKLEIEISFDYKMMEKQTNAKEHELDIFYKFSVPTTNYTSDNNTLNGSIELDWGSQSVFDTNSSPSIGTVSNNYYGYTGVTLSVPSSLNNIGDVYLQYGNGSFQKGIWENGVWNSGYRGTEYGYKVDNNSTATPVTVTTSAGLTFSVDRIKRGNINVIDYQTEPIYYFKEIERIFKSSPETWTIVLVSSAKEIIDNASNLNIGDTITIGNIIGIDINSNRKLIKDVFRITNIHTSNNNKFIGDSAITVSYRETFPLKSIERDSNRHPIYISKNIWVNGAFLNGYYEGIVNDMYVKGKPEITEFYNTQAIEMTFDGGRFNSEIKNWNTVTLQDVGNGFYPINNNVNFFHTSLIQNMRFIDNVSFETYDMVSPVELEDFENPTGSGISEQIKYIYGSDMDLVYQPEFFTSIFEQKILNDDVLSKAKLDSETANHQTILANIPAGYITYDVLSSDSTFTWTKNNNINNLNGFNLKLGSKYKKFDNMLNADVALSPNNNIDLDIPSTYNPVSLREYNLIKKGIPETIGVTGANGIHGIGDMDLTVHEEFFYITQSSEYNSHFITGDKSFKTRGRYHLVEADIEFASSTQSYTYYDDINSSVSIYTRYTDTPSYNIPYNIPKLTISQGYNTVYEMYETDIGATYSKGFLAPYDNNFIPFFNGDKPTDINEYGAKDRMIFKSFMFNNHGGFRDSVTLMEKDFEKITTLHNFDISGAKYYSLTHYEVDMIPFFNYKDFYNPLTGDMTESDWNHYKDGTYNQTDSRQVLSKVTQPYYATSIEIDYQDDNFSLVDNINFVGGNILNSNLLINLDNVIFPTNNSLGGIFKDSSISTGINPGESG